MKAIVSILFLLATIETLPAQVTQEWLAEYNGPWNSSDVAYSIVVDGSGNVYSTGYSAGNGANDYATIKYNSAGMQQWVARYNGPGNGPDEAYSIAIDGSDNVYVTGYSTGSGTGIDYTTIKYNSAGDSVWVARYNGPGNSDDYSGSISIDGSGNVLVTGQSIGSGTFYDYATIKYNSAGVQQWIARYNGPENSFDGATSITTDNSDNVYVTGSSFETVTDRDYATVKYNSSGTEQWVIRYNGPGNLADLGSSVKVDGSGNVYVTGTSDLNSSSGTG